MPCLWMTVYVNCEDAALLEIPVYETKVRIFFSFLKAFFGTK